MTPEVSIVIPSLNHLSDCLRPCLLSLINYTDLEKTEVIVVCNGCTDGSEEYVKSLNHPNIKLLSFPSPLGYTKATNEGIKISSGEFILLLNNDCVILHHEKHAWIEWLKKPFLDNKKMGITGPSRLWCTHARDWFIIFFCALIKRSVIDHIGLLDETFNPGGGEDTEYSLRCKQNGYEIASVSPESEVWSYGTPFPIYHIAEATVNGLPDWDSIFTNNSATLAKRYARKPKHSIIVLAPPSEDKLKRCINSLWQNTTYPDVEIILVANRDEPSFTYAQGILNFGPYTHFFYETRIDRNVAIMEAVSLVQADLVTIIDGNAYLQPHQRDGWLHELEKPFFERNVAITSNELNGGWASSYLLTCRVSLMKGFPNILEFILDRQSTHRTVAVGDPALGTKMLFEKFPIAYEP